MRNDGYWEHFLSLVEVEYQMLQFKKYGFSFELVPINSFYVNNIGRILNRDQDKAINANFMIIVNDSKGNTLKRVFTTSIPSN